jgi:sigma-E factor negative regulatory protein RseB
VLGEHGEILETSAFSDVSIGIRSQPEVVVASMKKLDGYKVVKPNLTPVKLEAEGWHLHAPVAGFKLVSCVMRPLEGPGGHPEQAPPASPALQAIFSDGLTYVSIFIEKFDADRHPQPMSTAIGATQTLMRRQDDAWITVMGDVPAATLRSFANSLERKK